MSLTFALVLSLASAASAPEPCAAATGWPLWSRYASRFTSADGRVIDRSADDRSTSEGQAYALFFALVANDRARFDRILAWTENNLAGGDLGRRLPAWLWGRAPDGRWKVLDPNAASDADLWLGYTLLEAGRLWQTPRHRTLGLRVLENVRAQEVRQLPGLGPMLLPGPIGFELERGALWRLNTSYLPPQLLSGLASAKAPGPWAAMREGTLRLLEASAPHGFAPDWLAWRAGKGVVADPVKGATGSYDAIRGYLRASMLPAGDPARRALERATEGLLRHYTAFGHLPEKVDAATGDVASGDAPPGFAAVLLAAAHSRGEAEAADRLRELLNQSRADGLFGSPPAYYDQNLALFSLGFVEGRYRFEPEGTLSTAWGTKCAR